MLARRRSQLKSSGRRISGQATLTNGREGVGCIQSDRQRFSPSHDFEAMAQRGKKTSYSSR